MARLLALTALAISALAITSLSPTSAQAQVPLRGESSVWPSVRADNPLQRILNDEASPHDRVAKQTTQTTRRHGGVINPTPTGTNQRTTQRNTIQRNTTQRTTTPNTNLPINARMTFDGEASPERYLSEYDVQQMIQKRAQRKRELRLLRLETQRFYGVSLSRPTGSPMMFGGVYAPNWIGGWNTSYGLRGQAPPQQLFFQYP